MLWWALGEAAHSASWFTEGKDMSILFIIAAILVVFWVLGFALHILAGFIHILLVLAIIAFIVGFLTRK
ncbi:MAG: hypothetical protein NVS2B16_31700 [Chloroflexota bacterium]